MERGRSGWRLLFGDPSGPAARVTLGAELAWRMYSRTLGRAELRAGAVVHGDERLADRLLGTVAIVA